MGELKLTPLSLTPVDSGEKKLDLTPLSLTPIDEPVKKKESTSAGINVQTSPLSPQSVQESGQFVFSATPPQLPSRSPIFRSTEKQEAVKKALTPKQGFNLQAFKEAATSQPTTQTPMSGTTAPLPQPNATILPNPNEIENKQTYIPTDAISRVEKNIASAKALNDVEAKFGKDILDINPRDYYASTGLAKDVQTDEGKNVELKNAYAYYNQLLNDDYQYYLDHIDALKPIVNSPTATQSQIDEYNKYVKRLNEIQERTKALPAELLRDQTGLFPDIAKREAENAAIGEKQEVKGLKPTDFLHLLAGPALPLEVGYSKLTGKDTGGDRAVRAISNTLFNKGGELVANLATLPKALSDAVEAKDWAKPIADMADVLGERGEYVSSELKARHPEIEQKTEFQTQAQKLLNTTADIAKLVVLSKGLGAAGESVGIPEAVAGKGAIFGATLATTHNDFYNGLSGMKMTEGEKQRYALGMSALTGLVFSAMPTLKNAVSGNLLKSEIDATIKENAAKIVSGEISPKQLAVQSILKVAAKTGRDIAESTIEQAVALPIAQNMSTIIYNKITGNNVPLMGNVNEEGVKEALLGNIIATGLFGAGNLVKDIKSPNTLREQAVIEAVKNPNFEAEISKAASEGKIDKAQADEAIKAVGAIKTLVNESGLSGTEADALASLQYKKMQSEKIAEGAKSEAVKAVATKLASDYNSIILEALTHSDPADNPIRNTSEYKGMVHDDTILPSPPSARPIGSESVGREPMPQENATQENDLANKKRRAEEEAKILTAQKRLKLPTIPEIFVSASTASTVQNIKDRKSITTSEAKSASANLYEEYKRLSKQIGASDRYTDEQINNKLDELGKMITTLENISNGADNRYLNAGDVVDFDLASKTLKITEQPKTEEYATQEKPVEQSVQAELENGNQSGQAPETSVSDKLRGESESPKEEVSPSIFSDMEALSTSPLNKKAETIKLKEKYGEDNVKRAKEINKMFDDIVKSMRDKGEIQDVNCD